MQRWRRRHFERARGFTSLTGRRSSGGYGRFGATASAARVAFSHINDSIDSRQTPCAPPTLSRRTWRIRQSSVYPQPGLSPWHARSVAVAAAALLHDAVMLAAGAGFLSCCQCVRATGYGLAPPSISEWVDIWRIDGLLTQKLYRNGYILIVFQISLSKPRIDSKMIKSAFQIPHHVAIRVFVYAPPRGKLSQNIVGGGDGFPHSEGRG